MPSRLQSLFLWNILLNFLSYCLERWLTYTHVAISDLSTKIENFVLNASICARGVEYWFKYLLFLPVDHFFCKRKGVGGLWGVKFLDFDLFIKLRFVIFV